MQLRLTVTRHNGAPPSEPLVATFDAQGGSIGRHSSNALELPDRSMEVSRQHARIEFRDGEFFVTDTSRNGLLLNDAMVGTGISAPIAHGDRLVAGGYEIEATILGEPAAELPHTPPDDPFAPQAPAARAPAAELDASPGAMSPGRGLLGGDAPRDVLEVLDKGSPHAASRRLDSPRPVDDFRLQPDRTPGHAESLPPMNEGAQAKAEAGPPGDVACDNEAGPIPNTPGVILPPDWKDPGHDSDEAPPALIPNEPPDLPPAHVDSLSPTPTPETAGADEAGSETVTHLDDPLLEAFLSGLDLKSFDIDEDEAAAVLKLAGSILRETVHGVRRVLIARSKIKDTFRLPVTRLQQVENNPLKFSVGVEDALEKLMDPDPSGYLPPVESVREVFEDLEIHEIAVITGMRAALERVLTRFEPDALEKRLETHFLENVVPVARKAKLWEMFTEQYEMIHREAKDAFDQLYGREFAEAYETEIRALKVQHARSKVHVDPLASPNLESARRDES